MSAVRLDYGLASRASVIMDQVRDADGFTRDLVPRLMGLPAMLRTSGLPATMAFLYAKAAQPTALGEAYETVRAALVTEIRQEVGWANAPADAVAFFTALDDPQLTSAGALARAAARVEELAVWLRRLTEALRVEVGDGGE